MEEEKWMKVMKFLRANPNILLKLVPSTLAVDEEGIEEMLKLNKNINKDLAICNKDKPQRVKSASRKKKIIKCKVMQLMK